MARISLLLSHQGLCSWIVFTLSLLVYSKTADSKPILSHTAKFIDLAECHNISISLLNVVSETLSQLQNDFADDFNCIYDDVDLQDVTSKHDINTINACLPNTLSKNPMCQKMSRTAFNETTCLNAIHADLKAFKDELYNLSPSLNAIVKKMMKALKGQEEEEKDDQKELCTSFNCKFEQCKVMLSFRLRSITISRILNYLKSTEDKRSPANSKTKVKKRKQ